MVACGGDDSPAVQDAPPETPDAPMGQCQALGATGQFYRRDPNPRLVAGSHTFGDAKLDHYGINVGSDGVRLTLQWSADTQPTTDATWFVHLLDANGQIVAQQDRAPQGGYAPLTRWTPGTPVTDRLFFPLASGTNTDGWTLRIGWVHPGSNDRVPVIDVQGQPVADGFILLPLR